MKKPKSAGESPPLTHTPPADREPALQSPSQDEATQAPAPYEPTLGELMGLPSVAELANPPDPSRINQLISDDPFALPPGFKPMPAAGPDAADYAFSASDFLPPPDARNIAQSNDDDRSAIMPPPAAEVEEIEFTLPDDPSRIRWTSRISILEAYQYNGSFKNAPPWIQRTWLAYGDADLLRQIPPGPCLRVPLPTAAHGGYPNDDGGYVLCRIGDFVCRQQMDFEDGRAPHIRTEVWAKEQFLKNFMPEAKPAPRSALPNLDQGGMNDAARQRRKA
jgi:hypothetical protein